MASALGASKSLSIKLSSIISALLDNGRTIVSLKISFALSADLVSGQIANADSLVAKFMQNSFVLFLEKSNVLFSSKAEL